MSSATSSRRWYPRAEVIHGLARYRRPDPTALALRRRHPRPARTVRCPSLHPPADERPGRTSDGAGPPLAIGSPTLAARCTAPASYSIVAIGGMGKSALTWTWFNDAAPAGDARRWPAGLWWSFYESDATFENFVTRALAYVSRRPSDGGPVAAARPSGKTRLLALLDREPFLVVLDGFERLLVAYARPRRRPPGRRRARRANCQRRCRNARLPPCVRRRRPADTGFVGRPTRAVGSFLRKLAGVAVGAHPHQHPALPGGPADGDRRTRWPAAPPTSLSGLGRRRRAERCGGRSASAARAEALLPLFHTLRQLPAPDPRLGR